MTKQVAEKKIAIKLNDIFIARLDSLAKRGSINRHQLMLCLVNIWINVLKNSDMPHLFYFSIILRDHEAAVNCILRPQREFSESKIPEKPLPVTLHEEVIFSIDCFANKANISRHQLMKNMIIVGIEELEEATGHESYQLGALESTLNKALGKIMKKGFRAFKAGIK